MGLIYRTFRPILFKADAEKIHNLTIALLILLGKTRITSSILSTLYQAQEVEPVNAFGLTFKNPIGLAAGFDKDAKAWLALASLGFSHIEVGTITPEPQDGNPKPRVHRVPDECAIINSMGFPSDGMREIQQRLGTEQQRNCIIGVNIGKNKDTPIEEAEGDYLNLFDGLALSADYVCVNISSPNTENLRVLQTKAMLINLLKSLVEVRERYKKLNNIYTPLLVKLSPDLNDSQLDDALDVIMEYSIDGVVATNTSSNVDLLKVRDRRMIGGISGTPIKDLSTNMISKISTRTNGKLDIIGVGGVFSANDVKEKLDAGAKLVQVYTGLIYQGPDIVKQILNNL